MSDVIQLKVKRDGKAKPCDSCEYRAVKSGIIHEATCVAPKGCVK